MIRKYDFFTTNEIEPKGWLKKQLEIQAAGLSGNLDLMWRDIKNSKWIGGNCEGWERVPYWLDGFVPLAYLLKDEDKINRAKNYIDAILANQNDDGWICPCEKDERETYDVWAMFLICKALVVYYECSNDSRVYSAVFKAMKNLKAYLDSGKLTLFDWGKYRWFEALIPISWIYDQCKEPWLLDLAKTLREQGADYETFVQRWEAPMNYWRFDTHIVNIAMMLKYEALCSTLFDEEYANKAEKLYRHLDKHNGTAVGTFTGDECLSGVSPIQGTELCAVVEQMYSYQWLFAATGDVKWADRLEMLAFNALPATTSDDMWTHQYVQMVNQISCEEFKGKPIFRTNGAQSHLFGLEPNFGCCTANFNQGWPKFALSAFMQSKNEIVNVVPIPSTLRTKISGKPIQIDVCTKYPFKNTVNYKVNAESAVEFNLKLRLPSWCERVEVNGKEVKKQKYYSIKKLWHGQEEITIVYHSSPKLISRPNQMKSVKYGPLVFAVEIKAEYKMREYEKDGVMRKFPYCDYELIGKTKWNWGFADDELTIKLLDGDEYPFSSKNPQIKIAASLAQINWGYEDGYDNVCARLPKSRKSISQPQKIELIPYACAKLRMTEMPKIKKHKTI